MAPLKERAVSITWSSPWYTKELALKVEGRKIERLYKKSGVTLHKLMFDEQQLKYHLALNSAREAYYSHMINEGVDNPIKLFKTINRVLKPYEIC